jgi:hypothetical protein
LEPAILNHYLVAGFEIRSRLNKAIASYPRSNQAYDLVIYRNRFVVETYQAMNSTRKSDAVVILVEIKTTKDVTREQGLNNPSRLAGKLVVFVHSQLRTQSLQSKTLQVVVSALFLFRMSVDNVPAKSVFA